MEFRGVDLTRPLNRLKAGFSALAVNVRGYLREGFAMRTKLTTPILTLSDGMQTVVRLNDSTPAGPISGFTYILTDISGNLYGGTTGSLTPIATGLTGNPVSIVPFRPNTSVQPWAYLGDSAPYPNVVITADSFSTAGMLKVRSDNLVRKMGIKEPQSAPGVSFPGGGSGSSLIYYYYTYRASETGAVSNPSPVSIPGTNSQTNPSVTQAAAVGTVINANVSYNSAQYEGNSNQIRTKGIPSGTITDYISIRGFGFSIPSGVTIDGIQIDLNWLGQNAGTGILSGVSLYYLGAQYGTAKFPAILNQSYSVDTLLGGNADTWGASLTPDVVNDSSFGFGVQITTQDSGGTDRSFINSFGIIVYYSTQHATVTPVASSDPQVDKIDFYRQGGGLANPTYVGSSANVATSFSDGLSDLAVANNPVLEYDNFEPFPSIDLPRSGVINASSQVLTWVSGDTFNTRWLPGTIILIGSPDQVAYAAVRRPTSTTSWDMTNNDVNVATIPDGTNLAWNIAEPALAQQPLPYLFGPTDNINYMFGVGDTLRPGTLYWCKGSNLDSAPDTNQMEVTDPGEPLVNGAMSSGIGVLFSIKRAWIIQPNFYNALATVTGTVGSTWSLEATAINRGLFIPRCVAVEGGGRIFFRVDDGILVSVAGGPPQSITDQTLYPLFTHEGSTPSSVTRNGVTFVPPDDSQPQEQQFSIQNGYLYYDYVGLDAARHTLVFDILSLAWTKDTPTPTVRTHAPNEGQSVQGVLVGCSDGTLREMTSAGSESVTGRVLSPAMGGSGFQHVRDFTVEYASNTTLTLTPLVADEGNGSYAPAVVTLPATTGSPTKYRGFFGPNKTKLMQFEISWSDDLAAQFFLDGFSVNRKDWGSGGAYTPTNPFAESGGFGGQP